jgi:protein tyrosine/serine phosphatase
MQDYLASNLYMAQTIRKETEELQQLGLLYMWPGLVVDQNYLQAGLNQVIASYGSMDGYLKEGLWLTQADIDVLRAKMVYYPTSSGKTH